MSSYTVVLNFNDGTHNYDLPHVFHVSDPKEGIKAVIHEGNRADGAIVIPGGKRPIEIRVRGNLFDSDGYEDLTTLMNTMRTNVTTDIATLTLKHWTGATWQNDWSYTVRRIDEINFPESLRTNVQRYEIRFLVIRF